MGKCTMASSSQAIFGLIVIIMVVTMIMFRGTCVQRLIGGLLRVSDLVLFIRNRWLLGHMILAGLRFIDGITRFKDGCLTRAPVFKVIQYRSTCLIDRGINSFSTRLRVTLVEIFIALVFTSSFFVLVKRAFVSPVWEVFLLDHNYARQFPPCHQVPWLRQREEYYPYPT